MHTSSNFTNQPFVIQPYNAEHHRQRVDTIYNAIWPNAASHFVEPRHVVLLRRYTCRLRQYLAVAVVRRARALCPKHLRRSCIPTTRHRDNALRFYDATNGNSRTQANGYDGP